jgi:peptidoglycan/LPS O-acetylase OafA/YrhL
VDDVVQEVRRVAWMDGLRGVAAVQVVLLHYASAFLPAIAFSDYGLAHFRWENLFIESPLFLPFDGHAAVCIFFVLSGVALTYSFTATQPREMLTCMIRRLVRLGLPMAAAILVGALMYGMLPDVHLSAGLLSGSTGWLAASPTVSAGSIAHQIVFEGLLTGYLDPTVAPTWPSAFLGLISKNEAFNPPLWSLPIELRGSVLVLILVALRTGTGRAVQLVTYVLIGCCVVISPPLVLFVVGHFAAPWLRRKPSQRWHFLLGAFLLVSGAFVCTSHALSPYVAILEQKMLGAVLIFLGLALLPVLQKGLEQPTMRWLGKVSFSLYLTHFPILVTAGSGCFIVLASSMSYGATITAVSVSGIAYSIAIAMAFERWVDRPAITLSRMVSLLRAGRRPRVLPSRIA